MKRLAILAAVGAILSAGTFFLISSLGRYRVIVLECPGGTDKGPDGHRVDTHFLLEALREKNIIAESIFYEDHKYANLLDELSSYDAYISRVDPGEYETCTDEIYFGFLEDLVARGVVPFNHPNEMLSMGSKTSLLRLRGMPIFVNNTFMYQTLQEFKDKFPGRLQHHGQRVLKQNRGSKGEGIWWVRLLDGQGVVGDDTLLQIVEAKDNHKETMTLREFTEQVVVNYYTSDEWSESSLDGMIDMEFLPRISEGEIRLIVAGREATHIVEKKPKASDAEDDIYFSANLGADAEHKWQAPETWPQVVEPFKSHLNEVLDRLGVSEPPILWTADFIRTGHGANTTFVLSEINSSCVGFSAFPELAQNIARNIADALGRHKPLLGAAILSWVLSPRS